MHDYLPARGWLRGWRTPVLRVAGRAYAFIQTSSTPMPRSYVRVAYDADRDVYTYVWWAALPVWWLSRVFA